MCFCERVASGDVDWNADLASSATLHRRIELFAALPVKSLDRISLKKHLDEIGAGAHAD